VNESIFFRTIPADRHGKGNRDCRGQQTHACAGKRQPQVNKRLSGFPGSGSHDRGFQPADVPFVTVINIPALVMQQVRQYQ